MDSFSWSDTIYAAFSSCLPCLRTKYDRHEADPDTTDSPQAGRRDRNQDREYVRRVVQSDELESLLADALPETDTEAETLSLHSNPGHQRRQQKKSKRRNGQPKRITFFGLNLFGKPAIQLPPDNDDLGGSRGSRRSRSYDERNSTVSSFTLDSDAPQLSAAVIDSLSPSQLEERAVAAEAEERRLKEERRQLKRERKALKKAALALALVADNDEDDIGSFDGAGDVEFEGFQGSGSSSRYPHIPSPFHSRAPTSPVNPSESNEGFGPYVSGNTRQPPSGTIDDDDGEAADLDGGSYARKANSNPSNGSSDSRSRTSTSRSQSDISHGYRYHSITQPPLPHAGISPLNQQGFSQSQSLSLNLTASSEYQSRRKKSKKTKSSSATSVSQSPSLRSPVDLPSASAGTGNLDRAVVRSPLVIQSPNSINVMERIVDGQAIEDTGFPIVGFSGVEGGRRKHRDMGAFLATNGEA